MKEKNVVWKTSSGVLTLLLVLPILAIFYTALGESSDLFAHLMSTVMPTYILNTIKLVVGVLLLSLIFGVPSAWLMAMCRLPTERVLQWALVLPLAMPGYIIGYIFTDWFDFAGLFKCGYGMCLPGKRVTTGSQIFARLVALRLYCLWCFIPTSICCAARIYGAKRLFTAIGKAS